jgi:hypothetical protein
VRFITDLRPGTVIKDEAIPGLLAREPQPTFVTINETDFWRRIEIMNRFGVVCVALPDSRTGEVAELLRRLLRRPEFRTKAQRMGCVVRMTGTSVSYYDTKDSTLRALEDW